MPLYEAVMAAVSHVFSVVPASVVTGGLILKRAQPAPLVDAAVMLSGATPVFASVSVCGADGVTVVVVTGGVPVVVVVIVARNGPNCVGDELNTAVFGGVTVNPFGNVFVHPVVKLVYVIGKSVVVGADKPPPAGHP